MAKVIFFDDIDFELKPGTSGDEVSTSGKWLDNGIYFTNPKSENEQPHHIAHDSYIYTLGSKVKPGDEYASKTEESNYYISVISGISANPFKKEITYDTTKYDLSGIFEDLSNMKQQILDILGRLNGQETVSSFTFSLSRTGITDNSFKNFVVGEPILAKITSITPSSGKYSNFNIIQSDDIVKIDHTVSDEDSFYFNTAKSTPISASIMTGSENASITSTINDITVSYAPIYTYPYSCGVRVAALNNVNINTSSPGISLQSKFTDIQSIIFNKLKDTPVETESNIANKKLSDYYNVNSYKVYYNNSYTPTTGTPSLLTYAIKQQNKPTFINTSVELNVKAYLVSYTVKTQNTDNLNTYTYAYNYAYITDITNATVNQYLGSNKTYYTCKNTCNGKDISGGPVAGLDFVTNKPHRKDILITYTLIIPSGITVLKDDSAVESQLQLTVGETVNLVVTLDNESELHNELKGITVAKTGDIDVNKTSIRSGETITVKANGTGSITFRSSKFTTVNKTITIKTVENFDVYKLKSYKDTQTNTWIHNLVKIESPKDIGINILPKGTVKSGQGIADDKLTTIPNDFYDLSEDDNPNTIINLVLQSNFEIYENTVEEKIELVNRDILTITVENKTYYYCKAISAGYTCYIQLK